MRFDWKRFFSQNHIPYVEHGPNTGRGNANIKCPWCGANDPSEHMGVNLRWGYWGCLRNSAHRGKDPVRLVRALLRCSEEEARRVVGVKEAAAASVDELTGSLSKLRAVLGEIVEETFNEKLTFPKEFKRLTLASPLAAPYVLYLKERGYRDAQIEWLSEHYELYYATKGLYRQRIVVPIKDRYGELLSWTARTIKPDVQPRYRTLRVFKNSEDGQGPFAKIASNHTVLGLPVLWAAHNPRVLVIVEGPFDALKVTAFGASLGVYATCLFGLNVYPAQIAELQELAGRFDRVYLLLDEDAVFQRLRIMEALRLVGVQALKMPPGTDDPGALSGGEVTRISLDLLSR